VPAVTILISKGIRGSAFVHALRVCRVGALMLATLIVGVVQNTNAVTLNSTDDGLSLPGIFFAKLEALHAKHMSGDIGTVRLRAISKIRCMLLSCMSTSLQPDLHYLPLR
jgi:uncharacterized integral membrane protein